MNNDYILSLIQQDKRSDERKFDEYRDIKIELNISKNAEGSARCKIGETEVLVGVKMDVGEPYPDSPDEGTIIVTAELTPIASPNFELGPPGSQATELARIVDRGIRESQAVDFKKLCIKKGELIWMVFIDIYPLNDDGNLIDASVLGALAALKHARFPKLEKDKVVFGEFTDKKLGLTKLPVTLTFGKINDKILLDLNSKEESAIDSRLSISICDGDIHAMQKGGDKAMTPEDIEKMVDIAIKKEKELRSMIK
ncbi:MAG: exosome complex protein Rrp42 [Nanoarchaeota archaeon]